MIKQLKMSDACDMHNLHAKSFENAWPVHDMETHASRDLSLGFGDPLSGLVILQIAADQAEILTIVTDPDVRRQGIAQRLLEQAENEAQNFGVSIIFLEVAEDNTGAIALYKNFGYETFGRRPAYYRRKDGRVAALTLRKRLDA